MQSKGNAPSAAQKRWREAVRDAGSKESGEKMQIHHPVGATAKHNKVHIGHWWVIPVDEQSHKDLHAGLLGKGRKTVEKQVFSNVVKHLYNHPDRPPLEALDAIMDYHI